MYIIIGISILIVLINIIVIYVIDKLLTRRVSKKIEEYKNIQFQKDKLEFNKKLDIIFKDKEEELKNADKEIERKKYDLIRVENEIKQKKEFNSSIQKIREDELERLISSQKRIKEEELNNLIKEKRANAEERFSREISEWAQSAQEAANFERDRVLSDYREEYDLNHHQLEELIKEIEEYRKKREAINKEILRSRAIEEQQDFYRIQLDNNSKEDIDVLMEIKKKLNKIDLLDKLIYDIYVSRPTKEMVKRVLGGKNPCGIYKVTNIKTNEVYIGKSVKIADRWTNHVKSACGLEGVAESQFQRALKKYGIDSFTWELLEECPKENLTEREKYFIIFYGTKDYGYNQREG